MYGRYSDYCCCPSYHYYPRRHRQYHRDYYYDWYYDRHYDWRYRY